MISGKIHSIVSLVFSTLVQGAGFPATHVLYSLWFPPLERTRYITFSHAGTNASWMDGWMDGWMDFEIMDLY